MAVNIASPAWVGKGGVTYYPGGDCLNQTISGGHGIKVLQASTGVDLLVENVRFQVIDANASNDIKVSLYGKTVGQINNYIPIAENVSLDYNTITVGGCISVIDESTSIWVLDNVAFHVNSLYAKVNDEGLGKVQVIIDYEIYANSSANGLALTSDYSDTIDQTDNDLYLLENTTAAGKFETFDNDATTATYSWSSSGLAASYITPNSGTISVVNGYGGVTFNTSSTGGATYTGLLTNNTTGGTTTFSVGPLQENFAMTTVYFTVAQTLTDSYNATTHRFGPTQTQVQTWMTGTSNGSPGYSWASDTANLSVPTDGYQIWRIPKTATYRIRAKGAHAGYTDSYSVVTEPATIVQSDFNLTKNNYLIIAVGQGVPVYFGDHCNGGAGATWVAHNTSASISGSECLIVAGGGPAGSSDGSAKSDPPISLSRSVSLPNGTATGNETDGWNVSSYGGNIATSGLSRSGSWLSSYTDAYGFTTGGFLSGDLIGGGRNNSTAGYGGFGGGGTGVDESGAGSGGFSGSYGTDNTGINGVGTSFCSTNFSASGSSCVLASVSTIFQNTDYKSEDQFQGVVTITQL